MRRVIIFYLLITILGAVPTQAGEMREIELNDGSIITGEVLSLAGGVYTVKSASLGTIKLDEARIRAIRTKVPASTPVQGNNLPGGGGDIRSVQEKVKDKLMSDEQIMSKILSLQNDPEFQKVLQDPEIMKAVNEGDMDALMANPQFMKLLNNSTVQGIQEKVK